VDALLARSRDACLLVVADGAPVAEQVAERADVPVIVDRPLDTATPAELPRFVVVGVAALVGCEPAVAFAFAEASLRGAPLLAVHVWSRPADTGPGRPDYALPLARDHAERMLAEAVAACEDKYPDVQVAWTTKHSLDVPAALAAAAHTAQLLVVGRPPHGGLPRPIPAKLIRRTTCSLAVIPQPAG
jgi:nucleotide-binding universal stress UspA family protein